MATPFKRKEAKPNSQGGTFRVLIGIHLDDGPPGCECHNCESTGGKGHIYESYGTYFERERRSGRTPTEEDRAKYDNDLVESTQDLTLNNQYVNGQPVSVKFERVDRVSSAVQQYQSPPEPFPLEKMTYPQLLNYALELGVESKDLKKPELIEAVRAAVKSKARQEQPAGAA